MTPQWLTVPEVAEVLRTTPAAVYKMVERRQLPGVVRERTRVLVEHAALVHYLHQNRASSQTGEL